MKKYIIIIAILAIAASGFILFSDHGQEKQANANYGIVDIKLPKADKIEVFLFHATQRCISCINVGKFAKKTIDDNFNEELKSGKIVFREINIDLLENYQLAEKFQASGSSLFINTIRDGKDYIEQDLKVWRMVGDEAMFESYFKEKIENILKN
ncbi:MAG: nitrophenyl compound nitroreductase subunit ArsF family protein [Candidatus Pacebacteria bacterium]|nr:nitrophenyl compound nitroreductase subunit ArsF family protein [Candidatus Paceibacterota bacterium]